MKRSYPALDMFRLIAAALVVAIHTSPLSGLTETGDFWLTRVLARIAVPFFLMVSGYFLAQDNWNGTNRFLQKTLFLYAVSVILYLPVNFYNGNISGLDWVRRLLLDGTLYHLWYFPAAMLGVLIARALARAGLPAALAAAGVLYLIGLGGDSWYGICTRIPAINIFYNGIFSVCTYTRNGLFYAPLFLLLGAAGLRLCRGLAAAGGVLALLAVSAEALFLRAQNVQRHDSMYLFLPVLMVCLFSLLLEANAGERKSFRLFSLLIYILHPMVILLVRGGAKAAGLQTLLIENSLVHYLAVLAGSSGLAYVLCFLRPARPGAKARAWRELDLSALRHNVHVLQSSLPAGCALMGVVKADAYGHGAVTVARALWRSGVRAFAVACLTEGIALRKAGIRGEILILGYTPPEEAALLRRWRLSQMVADAAHGQSLADTGFPLRIHLGLDTGMHRLGLPADDYAAISALYQRKNLKVVGIFSHLCVADSLAESDIAYTEAQLTRFYETVAWLRAQGFPTGRVHIQASYGVLNLPKQQSCGYARVGIALYGVRSNDAPVRRPLDLRPVLSLRARVTSVRTLAAGECAGYDRAFQAGRATRIAAVSIGYADGLPRSLPQMGGYVLLRGKKCPLIGRLCMDQALIDVTGVPEAETGDIVTLIGCDAPEMLRAEALAVQCGTITNELLSRLGGRLPVVAR
ncbi:MAG: serine racemase VanT catalytic subunit [Clostridiaceae bacterium]|nr:serine racemase VanT catalytic subunit [Clostridiaceae bacterium]